MIINSYFSIGGVPATTLTPTITVWEVDSTPSIIYTLVVDNDPVLGNNNDGFYSYQFTGYDNAKNYLIRVDGGSQLPPNERYSIATAEAAAGTGSYTVQDIVDGIWDEPTTNHISSGTMGAYQNETHSDVQQLRIDMITATSLIGTLLKYETNRTKIDKNAMTLTIYDDDGITALKVFNLKDNLGNPSITEVCERVPT
jgi:hypothetical protein